MAISVFRLPDLGEGLTDADVVEWYVAEGDRIALDQPVVALESAKAVVDIPSPVAGVVRRHCAQPGETVATGAPLVEFDVDAESDRADEAPGALADAAAASGSSDTGIPAASPKSDVEPGAGSGPRGPDEPGRHPVRSHGQRSAPPESGPINAMPAARARARALGVDLASVAGTGPGGRIRVADVERAAEQTRHGVEETLRGSEETRHGSEETRHGSQEMRHGSEETLRGVRKTMYERMALSGARVVPVTVTEDADIGDWRDGEDVTVRLIRAVLAGCTASQALNAWLDDGAVKRTLHRAVHLGIAADTGDGLLVPVLHDAGAMDPGALRAGVDRLRTGAAARSLSPRELDGATITLSNFGMLAGRYATPVVVPPQVAILGAGRAREEPVARGGVIAVRRRLPLSLTFDHRACTGAESSRFLAAVLANLESSE